MVATQPGTRSQVAPRQRTRGHLVAAIVSLSLALGAMLGATGYFWRSALTWEANAGAWEDQARRQGNEVAILTAQLDGTTGQISVIEDQLGEATNRITTLADEKAQLGDENAIRQFFLEQQQANLDYQGQVTAAAAAATDALASCADSQAQLIALLEAPEPTAAPENAFGDPTTTDPTVSSEPATEAAHQASAKDQLAAETHRLCSDAASSVATLRALLAADPANPPQNIVQTGTETDRTSEADIWNDAGSSAASHG